MTRTLLPAAASALLAMVGLPALAAPSVDGLDAAVASADAGDLDASAAVAPGADAERAARRGGKGGGKASSARSGGGPSTGKAAAQGGGARSGGPSASRSGAPAGRTGGPPLARPMTQRPGADRVQAAHPSNTAGRAAPAQSANRAAPASASRSSSSATRPSSSSAARPSSSAARPSSSAARPGNAAALNRPSSAQQSRSSSSAQHPSGSRDSHGSAAQRASSGSHAQRAHVGPQAANKVQAHQGRPSSAGHARPGASAKPHRPAPRHVVHHRAGVPPRWAVSYHRYHLHGVPRYSPRYWGAGVFYYNPPPATHRVVVVDNSGQRVKGATKPQRAVDRNNSFSVGLRSGSYMSGYQNGGSYGDLGMGVALRYRPHEAVALEMAWLHHSDSWDEHAERAQDPLSASVELFAFPWTRVSPYALLGVTMTPRAADDSYANRAGPQEYQANDALFGPHAGLGIEFAIGKKMSLNFDGRYIGYVDVQPEDVAVPAAFQGNMGLNFHF
ncbi:MAG: hypothetical protein H6742_14040 [Alphaproteobacteria bacterium]|nr:hypothetical protein [Alphaproteobacteria bacterium]